MPETAINGQVPAQQTKTLFGNPSFDVTSHIHLYVFSITFRMFQWETSRDWMHQSSGHSYYDLMRLICVYNYVNVCNDIDVFHSLPFTTHCRTHTQTHTKRSHFVSSTIEQKNVIFYPTIGYTHRRNAATATRFDIKIDCARSHSKWQKWNSIEVGSVSTKCQPRRMRLLRFKSKCVWRIEVAGIVCNPIEIGFDISVLVRK